MKPSFASVVSMVLPWMGTPAKAHAPGPLSKRDEKLIEALLERFRARKDVRLVREDKMYDAETAAWYLKYKWDHNKDKVHSVEDFVALASYGGEHGEITYYVRFNDGARKPAREVLEEAVRKLLSEQQTH